jgi:hypothetical protein
VEDPVRSVRVGDPLWEKAKRRAAYEGITMSQFLYAMVEGYANNQIGMPQVQVVYHQPVVPAPVTEEDRLAPANQ